MARKKKRGRSKQSNPTKKRAHKRKKHRSVQANPRRKFRRSHKRVSNPRRHRRSHARRRMANPGGFRRKSYRRHSRRRMANPGGPYGQAAIAVAAGAAAFVGVNALTYYATTDMAKDGQRNAKIIGGLVTAAGLYLAVAKKKLGLGIALAAGGLLGGFGNFLILKLMQHLPAKAPAPKQGAVFAQNMEGYQQIGAVAYDNLSGYEQLGAVAYDNMSGIGEPVPSAPWESESPF